EKYKKSASKLATPAQEQESESAGTQWFKSVLNNPVSGAVLWAGLGRLTSNAISTALLPKMATPANQKEIRTALAQSALLGMGVCYAGSYFTHTGTNKDLGMKMVLATAVGALSMKLFPIKTPKLEAPKR
ncbi:MAG TPA: hypothetical protein VFF04_06780, partial [Candidatus Babeliales bacterium]|nr:hypothetical protein [Candidatus Babeliales bacterium]